MAEACAAAGADIAIWGTNADKNAAAETRAEGDRAPGGRPALRRRRRGRRSSRPSPPPSSALGKVDACFANAGIMGLAPFIDMTLEHWRGITRVNLDGVFLTLREAARHMVERGEGGALIGISSVSAIHGAPMNQAYAASKAGLNALIRGLAVELARHRIRVQLDRCPAGSRPT